MAPQQVYTDYYKKKYEAPVFSIPTFLTIVMYVVALLLPFFMGYLSGGFYKTVSEYHEHPNVDFTNLLLFQVAEKSEGLQNT